MTETLKVFLRKSVFEELHSQYENKEAELRKEVFGYVQPLAKQGRLAALNQKIQITIMENEKSVLKEYDLKDLDVVPLECNKVWTPKSFNANDEIRKYELTVSDKLFNDLKFYADIFSLRVKLHNDSLNKKSPSYTSQIQSMPDCLEQIIHEIIAKGLSKTLYQNIDKEYDEDFKEIEKSLTVKKN